MAIPVYVYAFVYQGLWESFVSYSKPAGLLVAIFVMASYPYVYLLSYQAFSNESRELREASEIMGFSNREYVLGVRWPLARPLIWTGFFVVFTEFIADFGAVQLFGLTTFSTAIYKLWTAYLSFGSAAFVSLILLASVSIFL